MTLPVRRPHELPTIPEERRWLVEPIWADEAVGIVGGEPKCCKSFLALDLAVAVASGAACLRRFEPRQTGPVLLLAAEDGLPIVRRRIEGIAAAGGVPFRSLDIHVITRPRLRLDLLDDRRALRATVEATRPKLLVLDPFIRLHRVDENVAGDVAPLLGFLREIQREHHVAVLLVHHAKKGAAAARPGQALRGSSELHAWGDSNLYLRWAGEVLKLTVEHRAAPSPGPFLLELREEGEALALHADPVLAKVSPEKKEGLTPAHRIERALRDAAGPLGVRELRDACRMRTATLCQTLDDLAAQGRIRKSDGGYFLEQK